MRVAKISGEKRMRTEEGASFQNDPGVHVYNVIKIYSSSNKWSRG